MKLARCAITGLGVVAPLGVGLEPFWSRLLALEPALCPTPPARSGLSLPAACVFAKELAAEEYVDARWVRKSSNLSRMALVAADACLRDADFPPDPELRERTAVSLGTAFGSSAYYLRFHEAIQRRGPRGANSVLFTESVFNAAPGHVSAAHDLHGASHAVAGGEEAGLSALVAAFDRVRLGAWPAVIAGGVEEYSDLVHASLLCEERVGVALQGLSSALPGPLAEGAALLLLEEVGSAARRGARVRAEVLGAARTRSRPGAGAPSPAGAPAQEAIDALRRAAELACAEADIEPGDLDLVVAGGCGGLRSRRELAALDDLFAGLGAPVPPRWLTAPQALLGEGFAFTSAALALVAVHALATGVVPPTPGAEELRVAPGLPEGLVCAEAAVEQTLEHALVLASTAAGGAVALVLGRPSSGPS